MLSKNEKFIKRKLSVRSKIRNISKRIRLSVYRSNTHISAQIIDDKAGKTLVSVSSATLSKEQKKGKNKTELAKEVGLELAKKAKTKKVTDVVFDRGGYRYHGRVKALADAAREGGLKF